MDLGWWSVKIRVPDWGIWCYTSCGVKPWFVTLLVKGLVYELSFGWYLSNSIHNHRPRSFGLEYCGPCSFVHKKICVVTWADCWVDQLTEINNLPLSSWMYDPWFIFSSCPSRIPLFSVIHVHIAKPNSIILCDPCSIISLIRVITVQCNCKLHSKYMINSDDNCILIQPWATIYFHFLFHVKLATPA